MTATADERFDNFMRWAQQDITEDGLEQLTYAVLAVADRMDALLVQAQGMQGVPRPDPDVEHLCEVLHDAYEEAAVQEGWATQERSRKPWDEVPEENKATMRAAVSALLRELQG